MLPDDDDVDTPPRDRDPAIILERFRADFEYLRDVAEQMDKHRDRVRRRYESAASDPTTTELPADELAVEPGEAVLREAEPGEVLVSRRGGIRHKLSEAAVARIREIVRDNPDLSMNALQHVTGHHKRTIRFYIDDFPSTA